MSTPMHSELKLPSTMVSGAHARAHAMQKLPETLGNILLSLFDLASGRQVRAPHPGALPSRTRID